MSLNVGRVLLAQSVIATDATTDFDGVFTSAYDVYEVEFNHVIPVTDAVELYCRLGVAGTYDSGSVYTWSSTRFGIGASGSANTVFQLVDSTTIGIGNDAAYGVSGQIRVYAPASATLKTMYTGELVAPSTSVFPADYSIAGAHTTTEAHSDIRFYFSSGNLSSGTITVYGVR